MTVVRISDLEKTKGGPVWAINKTRGASRSLLVLSVPKPQGGSDSVKIPVTYLPVDLTGQVPKGQLMASSDFRRAVTSGYLELIDEASANKILEGPGAAEELRRLREEDNSLTADSARLTAGTEAEEAVSATMSPRVQQFLANLEEATNATSVLNTLRAMGELEEAEYAEIRKVAESKRGFDEVVAFCDEAILN